MNKIPNFLFSNAHTRDVYKFQCFKKWLIALIFYTSNTYQNIDKLGFFHCSSTSGSFQLTILKDLKEIVTNLN